MTDSARVADRERAMPRLGVSGVILWVVVASIAGVAFEALTYLALMELGDTDVEVLRWFSAVAFFTILPLAIVGTRMMIVKMAPRSDGATAAADISSGFVVIGFFALLLWQFWRTVS